MYNKIAWICFYVYKSDFNFFISGSPTLDLGSGFAPDI